MVLDKQQILNDECRNSFAYTQENVTRRSNSSKNRNKKNCCQSYNNSDKVKGLIEEATERVEMILKTLEILDVKSMES